MPRIRTGTAAETVFYLKSRLSYPGEGVFLAGTARKGRRQKKHDYVFIHFYFHFLLFV